MLRRTVIALVMAFFCAAALMPAQAEAAGKIGVANPMRLSNQSNPGKEAEAVLLDGNYDLIFAHGAPALDEETLVLPGGSFAVLKPQK